jgi:hypothetical protein
MVFDYRWQRFYGDEYQEQNNSYNNNQGKNDKYIHGWGARIRT